MNAWMLYELSGNLLPLNLLPNSELFLTTTKNHEKISPASHQQQHQQHQQQTNKQPQHDFARDLEKYIGTNPVSFLKTVQQIPVVPDYSQFWQLLPLFRVYYRLAWLNMHYSPVLRVFQDSKDLKTYNTPKGISIVTMEHTDGSVSKTVVNFGVHPIQRGAQLGPLEGRRVKADRVSCDIVMQKRRAIWEVMKGDRVDHFIDLTYPRSNWTRFVRSAKYFGGPVASSSSPTSEYNLELVQKGQELYFVARQDIPHGQQLVAWYSHHYNIVMGVVIGWKGVGVPGCMGKGRSVVEKRELAAGGVTSKERGRCDRFQQLSIRKYKKMSSTATTSVPTKTTGQVLTIKPNMTKVTPSQLSATSATNNGVQSLTGPGGSGPSGSNAVSSASVGEGFPCSRCGKVFAYQYYRDKHLKYTRCIDRGDRKFPCSLCTRSFEKRDRLRIHVLHVHEKHRPHKCAVCGKTFSQSSSLNKHFRVHSGERPYKCTFCSKSFTASSILRTHMRQHSGEKPFKCRFCPKSFASHAAHDSHVRRTHPEQSLLECLKCGLKLESRRLLNIHLTLSHK